jgi:ssDNA thymidine ADP-ribosyltransferase, DarT
MDIDQMVDFMSTHNKCLYHFTDRRNIDSIRSNGLMSMRLMKEAGIEPVACGGNDWSLEADVQCGMDRYVHLGLTTSHPLEFKAKNAGRIEPTYIRVDPTILKTPGVMFTSDVANKSGVIPEPLESGLDKLDLEVIFAKTDWKIAPSRNA